MLRFKPLVDYEVTALSHSPLFTQITVIVSRTIVLRFGEGKIWGYVEIQNRGFSGWQRGIGGWLDQNGIWAAYVDTSSDGQTWSIVQYQMWYVLVRYRDCVKLPTVRTTVVKLYCK